MKQFSRSKFREQVGTTFLTQMSTLVFSTVTSIIIARGLGPEGKGILTMALLIPGIMIIFLNGGIGVANVYFLGLRRINISTMINNSIIYALLATILGMFIIGGLLVTGSLHKLIPKVPI